MNKSSSDDTGNTNTATESLCPKGWTLPSTKQINSIGNNTATYVSALSPVLGGHYDNTNLNHKSNYGFWWGSEEFSDANRYYLSYGGTNRGLYTNYYRRHNGFYIRCVSEEKTVTDLTYLQDMTGGIANNTLDGTTASLITRWLPRTYHLRSRHLRH